MFITIITAIIFQALFNTPLDNTDTRTEEVKTIQPFINEETKFYNINKN